MRGRQIAHPGRAVLDWHRIATARQDSAQSVTTYRLAGRKTEPGRRHRASGSATERALAAGQSSAILAANR